MVSIPNLLTLLRLLLAPVIIRSVLIGEHRLALVCFFIAGLTDGVDGFLARRFGWTTTLGAYLDPIADKTLLSGIYLAFAVAGLMPGWFVALIFGRDLFIVLGAAVLFAFVRIRKFPPSVWGKLSTFLQIVTAVAWLIRNVFPYPAVTAIAQALILPAAVATAWSGLHYAWRGIRLLRTQ